MLNTLAVANYRSINKLVIPLGRLNLITGPNGSGKSNLYRALRLLAETAQGGVVNALAREGGLDSTFWAGPETISLQGNMGIERANVEPCSKLTVVSSLARSYTGRSLHGESRIENSGHAESVHPADRLRREKGP